MLCSGDAAKLGASCGSSLGGSLGVDGVFLESFVETQIVRVVYHRNTAHLGYCAQYWVWCECIWKEKIAILVY